MLERLDTSRTDGSVYQFGSGNVIDFGADS